MNFKIKFEREDNGPWIAETSELPGVMPYGAVLRAGHEHRQAGGG